MPGVSERAPHMFNPPERDTSQCARDGRAPLGGTRLCERTVCCCLCGLLHYQISTRICADVAFHVLADTPKKGANLVTTAFDDLKKLDRQLVAAEDDAEYELRKGLRNVLSGSQPGLPALADELDQSYPAYNQYDTRNGGGYPRQGYLRGPNDEDDEMLDADPLYDDYDDGQGIEWAEQEYDERYPDGYPDDYYGEYEGEELGALLLCDAGGCNTLQLRTRPVEGGCLAPRLRTPALLRRRGTGDRRRHPRGAVRDPEARRSEGGREEERAGLAPRCAPPADVSEVWLWRLIASVPWEASVLGLVMFLFIRLSPSRVPALARSQLEGPVTLATSPGHRPRPPKRALGRPRGFHQGMSGTSFNGTA